MWHPLVCKNIYPCTRDLEMAAENVNLVTRAANFYASHWSSNQVQCLCWSKSIFLATPYLSIVHHCICFANILGVNRTCRICYTIIIQILLSSWFNKLGFVHALAFFVKSLLYLPQCMFKRTRFCSFFYFLCNKHTIIAFEHVLVNYVYFMHWHSM